MRTYVRLGLLLTALALGVLASGGTPAYAWSYPAALNTNAATDSGYDWGVQVTTDGLGHWVAVWTSNENLGGIGTEGDILVARSTNNGVTWTAPAALNTNAASDAGFDYDPQVTTDGGGNWVAVWHSNENLGGTIGTDGDILVARSTDNGATWTAPAALNTNAASDSGDDELPQVTTDGVGHWVAAWRSEDSLGGTIGTDEDILVARSTDNGEHWTDPEPLNTNAATDSGSDGSPQVTTDGLGHWVAVWNSNGNLGGTIGWDGDILVARSTDNGEHWTDPAALNTNAAADSESDHLPQVTTDGGGKWVAVWASYDDLGGTIGTDTDILVARSTDNGEHWTDPEPLNTNAATDDENDERPQVATDGGGNWVAVWDSRNLGGTIGTDRDIAVARSTDNGATWTDPEPLNTNAATDSGRDTDPQVTTDGGGNWVAVWDSDDSLGGTIGTDPDILAARSTDNGATWTAPAALNTNAATDSAEDFYPQVTTDGLGHWVAVWNSDDDILVARSDNNGVTWTAPAVLTTNSAWDRWPRVATDGGGNWLAVWMSSIGSDVDILVVRSTDNGATWTAPAALNTNAATDSDWDGCHAVASDGEGNWVAVWARSNDLESTFYSDFDVVAARSTDDGVTWSEPTVLNTIPSGDPRGMYCMSPEVAGDGGGNWVTVWENLDGTLGTDSDILTARSTDNGATWMAPAALNTNAATDSGRDGGSQVTTDGNGNWVAVWGSSENLGGAIGTDYDILVARSTDNGATWTAPAALNTNAATDSGDDGGAQAATDGMGHWVTVWESDDSLGGTIGTDYDILYATCSPLDADCDGVPDSADTDPADPFVCQDLDTDTCDDCSVLGQPDVSEDGTDTDADGACNAGDPDDDNDGITDEVDAEPLTVSAAFSDQALGGTTFGILERHGLTIEAREEPNPAGVRVTASGGGGPATVDVCAIGTLDLTSGDDIVVTCGSATIEVVAGSVTATFGPLRATLPADTTATVVELAPGAFEVTNSGGSSTHITVNGIQIPPGGSETDDDGDGFFTSAEQYLPTDPLDACPDDTSDDAWPLDMNKDTFITVSGDVYNYRGRIGETGGPSPSANWQQRLDLNWDNFLTVAGDVFMYRGMIGETCT